MYVQHCRVGKHVYFKWFKIDSYIEYMQGPNTHSHFDLYAKFLNKNWSQICVGANYWL